MDCTPHLDRRDFLRGTAALVGGSALGLLPALAEAALRTPISPLLLAVWDGRRFVPVRATGGGRAAQVRLTVSSALGGGLAAIEAHAPDTGAGRHAFVLWVAPPAGLLRHCATVAMEADGRLVLAVHAKGGGRHEVALPGIAGTYVLASGASDLDSLGLDETGEIHGATPHVRLDVERA